MKARRSLVLMFALVLGIGALWATASMADRPERAMLPAAGVKAFCPEDGVGHEGDGHTTTIIGFGTFTEVASEGPSQIMIQIGEHYFSKGGLKTVPFQVVSIGGRAFAEGVGDTKFWLDSSRPVTSAIWEKAPDTEFPAAQEMRFHFFYTIEAMPGKVFRSINPARMRSENVRSFPPPPGTVYNLAAPVELEDVKEPGIVAGVVHSNRVVIPRSGARPFNRDMN